MKTRAAHRWIAAALVCALLSVAAPAPARAESSGINAYGTVGLLLLVVGTLGWVAWTAEREDKEDLVQARAILPLHRVDDADTAFGLLLDEREEDGTSVLSAGLAIGRRF